jgi:hypothetical protein
MYADYYNHIIRIISINKNWDSSVHIVTDLQAGMTGCGFDRGMG